MDDPADLAAEQTEGFLGADARSCSQIGHPLPQGLPRGRSKERKVHPGVRTRKAQRDALLQMQPGPQLRLAPKDILLRVPVGVSVHGDLHQRIRREALRSSTDIGAFSVGRVAAGQVPSR